MEEEEDIRKIIDELKDITKQTEAANNLFYFLIKHGIDPDEIIEELRKLLSSSNMVELNGGILASNKILEVGKESKVLKFVTAIMPLIFKNLEKYDQSMIKRAVGCLGNLAQSGGSFTQDNVIYHINTCFEWIRIRPARLTLFGTGDSKVQNRKYGAILLLTEYCNKLPALSYNHFVTNQQYKKLLHTIGDAQLEVRHAIVDLIKAISKLVNQRDPEGRKAFFDGLYILVEDTMNSSSDEKYLHGCLIVSSFLFTDSGDFLKNDHEMLIKHINVLLEKRKDLIRPQCIQIYPVIAEFAKEAFLKYRVKILKNLLDIAKSTKGNFKGLALKSLGKLGEILKEYFPQEYMDYLIKLTISEIESSKSVYFNEALGVIADVCKHHGEALESATDIIDLINKLFRYGLSKNLIATLGRLSKICNYRYKQAIEIKLLNVISLVL